MKKKNSPSLFVGFKSRRAIPVHHHLRRDLLIQSTLNSGIRRIEYHPALRVDDSIQQVDAIILDADAGRYAVDLVDARPACDPMAEGLMHLAFAEQCSGIMTVTELDIRREPRFSAAREVWRHRVMIERSDDREAVLGALEMRGPLPLCDLPGVVELRRDIELVIYAMACAGSVTLDLRCPLDHRTIVRAGNRPVSTFGNLAYGT